MVGVDGTAERDDDLLRTRETRHQLLGHAAKTALVDGTGCGGDVEALGVDAEHLVGILLVAEDDVAALHEGGHHLGGLLAVFPEVLAVIEVAADGQAETVRGADRFKADVSRTLAESRGDTGPVEPLCPVQYLIPVYHARLDGGDGRAGTVVDDLARPRHGAGLEEIDPQTVTAGDAAAGINPVRTEVADATAGYIVVREAGDEPDIHAEIGE